MIKFVVKNRKTGEQQGYQFKQNTILIGRTPQCDVVLNSVSVSRHHAQLIAQKNKIEIQDLESGNGTVLNQTRLNPNQKYSLDPSDTVRIEEFEIFFDKSSWQEPEDKIPEEHIRSTEELSKKLERTDPDILEVKMIKRILGALEHDKRPCLFVISEPFQNLKGYLEDEETDLIIGRDQNCGLAIDSPAISRHHAKISRKWGGFVVTDLDSKNKIFVNGEKVREKTIHDGDEIIFDDIQTIFKNPNEFSLEKISQTLEEKDPPDTEPGPSLQAKISVGEEKPQEKIEIEETPQPEKETPKKPFLLQSLSPLEKILLGFGIVTLILILIGLAVLI